MARGFALLVGLKRVNAARRRPVPVDFTCDLSIGEVRELATDLALRARDDSELPVVSDASRLGLPSGRCRSWFWPSWPALRRALLRRDEPLCLRFF